MKLLATKFYPVDVENQVIYLEPCDKERDVAHKWDGKVEGKPFCIGLRGSRLMFHDCYGRYKRVPTVTREQLLKEWEDEVKGSCNLWKSAAVVIHETLRDHTPDEALKAFKKYRREFRNMAISASYGRAVRDVKELLVQQALAA